MYKLKTFLFALLLVLTVAPFSPSCTGYGISISSAQLGAEEQNGTAQVQLIMKKLRASISSMKDFDDLEAVGMSKEDVDRMRRAMMQKIEKLTSEANDLIRAL